jgi:ribosomal protein S12 methylthiotransferase accessory factor YcaO
LRADAGLSWYRATRITDGNEVLLPADLCLRRPTAQQEIRPPFALSTGSAAGTSWDEAALHGLLELIERDAAGLWWRGGRRGIFRSRRPTQMPWCGSTRLEQLGIETFSVDLTRPRSAVPVARIIAPGLQLEPSELVTPRLATMIAQTCGGERYTGGVLLI